jgi:predicted RNA binding protein YcfA (HicA-like mRNA interferase family)
MLSRSARRSVARCGVSRLVSVVAALCVDHRLTLPLQRSCVYIHIMHSRDVIAALQAAGWYEVGKKGSHLQLKHPKRSGRVTVPHPKRDIPLGTLRSIEKQAGLKLR